MEGIGKAEGGRVRARGRRKACERAWTSRARQFICQECARAASLYPRFFCGSVGTGRGRRTLEKRRPRDLAVPVPNLGVGVRHALFPDAHLGRSRFRGRCASRRHSVRQRTALGLMAGPSRPSRDGILSEASAPRSDTSCREWLAGRGADTPATWLFRVGTVLAGTAPAFGRALAPCYGSSLLTLRLRSDLQLGDAGWRRRPKRRRFDGLCRARSLPASPSSLRASPM